MQYRVPSEIQSLPLMKSTHECEQELDKNGLLKSALIRETHTFRPFSRATSGATTKVLQKLNYKTQRSGVTTRQDYIRNRANVVFEHVYGRGNKDQPARDAESKLREICQNTREDIRPDTGRLFSDLVNIVKNLHIDDIRSIYQQLKSGAICTENSEKVKSMFLDTIPMASTSISIAFLKEILLKKEVTGAQATIWITSLSLIHYPTLEMLQDVKALLDTPQYSKAAMLPISTMVNNYCNHHEACSEEFTITRIISTMEKSIGYGCYIRDSNLETSLVAIRALGNAGHVDRLTTRLSSCFNKQANPMAVRVAAIQAYRRLPCTADRSEVMTIYQDSDEDSELRIAAYLAVMQCPSEDVLGTIQGTLESEKANQVGAFVWSHLTNLMETSSPQKQTVRRILQAKTLERKFDLSTLKYSRNYEGSLFLEKFNTGAMLESNVIFSDKSALPRSAMFNMTVDLFGNSLNLFELGGRMEGVEYLIEKYLSQYTFFRDWLPKKEMISDNISDMKGDMYMKFFGNEMYYGHFKGVDPIASVKNFNFLELMSKKQDYSFTQSMMILDSSMIIPTSSGLPLNLNVNGTGIIDLQVSGEVDLRNMMASPRSLLIDGIIKPSGTIKIVGTMSMDASVTKTGLSVVNTWHSSTALKGRVELNRGKILSVDIDFPQEKMEILDVSTEFFSIHGDQDKKQDLVSGNRKKLELCTGARLATFTGLELCNEFQWPNASMVDDAPYFPFTGPFSQSLVLYKRDKHTGYKLMAKQSGAKQNTFVQFILNTPGSRTDRTIDVSFTLKKKTKDFEMNALTPWKKATLKGSVTFEKKDIGLQCHLTVDESSEYIVTSEVDIKRTRSSVTYIPRLEIRRPRAKVILLSGTVEVEANKKANVVFALKGLTKNAVSFKSSLMNSNIEKSLKGTFSLASKQDYVLEAGWMYQKSGRKASIIKVIPTLMVKTPKLELVSLKGEWEYKESKSLQGGVTLDVHKLLRKPITLQCDMYEISGKKTKHSAKLIVRSEFLDAKVTGNMEGTKKTVNPTIILEYKLPKAYSGWNNKHTFRSKLADHNTKTRWKYMFHMGYTNQQHPNLSVFLKSDLAHSTRHTKAVVTVKYGMKIGDPDRHITGSASVDHHLNKRAVNIKYKFKTGIGPMDVSFDFQGKYNSNSHTMESELGANLRKYTGGSLKNKTVSTSVECGFTRNAKETTALVEIKTPLHQLKNLNAEVSLDHATQMASLVGSFSTGRKENKITYAAELKMPSNTHNGLELSAIGVLSSPSNDDRVYELYLHHVGGIVNFKTKGSLSYDERKQIKGAISFLYSDLAHIDFEGEITTPFEGYENNTVKYQHSFGKSEAALTAEAIYGFNQRALFSFSLANLTIVRLAITLKTTSGNNVVSFTYTGPLNNSQSQTEIEMFGYSNLVQIVYKHGHKMRVLFTSNNKSMQVLKVSFNFEITPTTLNTSALYTLEDSTFEGMVVGVKEGDRTKVVLKFRTPFQDFRETGLSYQHYKDWRNVYATLRYMDAKDITFSMTNNRTRYRFYPVNSKQYCLSLIELTTPFRNFEIFSFRFDGLLLRDKMSGNTTFMYGNHKQITIDSIWTNTSVTFLAKTPFEKYRTSEVVLSGLRNGSYYYGKMDIRIDDMVITLYSTTKTFRRKVGNITLHTNLFGYELMEGSFNITQDNRVLNATSTFKINNQTLGTEFVFRWRDGFHTHLTIFTPAENFTNIGFTFDHITVSGKHPFEQINIRYRDDQVITFIVTVHVPSKEKTLVKVELITPFTGYERQHFLFSGRCKSYKTFKNEITLLNSKGEQLTLSSDFALYSFVDINVFFKSKEIKGRDLVKLSFRNPSVRNVTVTVETNVPLVGFENCILDYHHFIVEGSFEAALKLESNGSKYIAANVHSTFSTNKFHGSVVIDSDVYTFRNITVVLSKEGVLENVRAKGLIRVAESTYESLLTHVLVPGTLRKLGGEMMLNWDRNNPESNFQVQAKLIDRKNQALLNKDLTLNFIHPSRTVGIIGNVLSSRLQTWSHGEFIWNEVAGNKLFYDVNVKDRSHRNSKIFDGSLKVGSPLRSLQMDGSYSQTGASQTVDGAFSWDADRDATKKIGMKAVLTPGDKNKQADLSLRLPSIGKNIQLDTAMLLNDGRTVFNGKTQLSYSGDSRKTLTLTAIMNDISNGNVNTNYSFVAGIRHPYTDMDVQLTSHIGSSSEKVSAGMDIAYLTTRRERKNFALEGELNTAMQILKLKMQCPIKHLEAYGVMGENPFKIVINNRTLATVLTSWKAVELETRFDLDNPGRILHVDARYMNSSAMQAEVFHREESNRVSDSIVALRLNTSCLLHARISWRPQLIADVQAYLTRVVERNGQNAKTTLDSVYESMGEELSGKYHRIAQVTKEELSPYLDLLESEMAVIEKQLDSIRKDIRIMYKRNDFYMADMENYSEVAEKLYNHLVKTLFRRFIRCTRSMTEHIQNVNDLNVKEIYDHLLNDLVVLAKEKVDTTVEDAVEMISSLDDMIRKMWGICQHHYNIVQRKATATVDTIMDLPHIVDSKLEISNSIAPYMDRLYSTTVKTYGSFKDLLMNSGDMISSHLINAEQRSDLQMLFTITNNVYEEGGTILEKHLHKIPELVKQEFTNYTRDALTMYNPQITVWDPERGEIQIELCLPIPLRSLDRLPDVQPYIQNAKTTVSKYIPDRTSLKRWYKKYSAWRSNRTNGR